MALFHHCFDTEKLLGCGLSSYQQPPQSLKSVKISPPINADKAMFELFFAKHLGET
jgi:hypothetical protein